MNHVTKHITGFIVAGLTVRTKNSDEFDPLKTKIPALWEKLFTSDTMAKIPNQPLASGLFGVYSGYESGASGEYDLTVGALVNTKSGDYNHVEILSGNYLVFEARGEMPGALIQTWGVVWHYFEKHPEQRRLFKTDFEQYLGDRSVDIHIGIQ